MSIEELGALGEFVSGIAVLITLVYRAIQTKTNTKALRAQTHQQIADSRREIIKLFLEYPSLDEAVRKIRNDSKLSDEEFSLLLLFSAIATRHHENELYQFSQGMLDKDEMETQRKVMLQSHILLETMAKSPDMYSPTMQREIKELLKQRENA